MEASEHRSHIETFFNWYDAASWLEHHLSDYHHMYEKDWVIEQASINYINHTWRAGFVMSRRQGDFFGN